jgi:hypothetical protein
MIGSRIPHNKQPVSFIEYREALVSSAKKRLIISALFGAGIIIVLLPILGSLIVMGLAMATSSFASLNDAHRKSVVLTIIDQAQRYYVGHHLYPTTIEELIAHENFPEGVSQELLQPQTKTRYIYTSTLDGKNCAVITVLTDKSVFEKQCKE